MAKLFKSIAKLPFGLIGAAVKPLAGGGKKKPAAVPLPQANRDEAVEMARREDELRRRQGAASDMLTGSTGAGEALGVGKFNIMGS